ncbi:hypothetical protein D3C79_1027870 [compost metagenome]
MADKGGVERTQAVTGEVEITDWQAWMLGAHGLHDPVHVFGVFLADAGGSKARGCTHEVIAGGR